MMLLYTFLVICFSRYNEYIICLTSFSEFSDVLAAFTYARAIGSLLSFCLGINTFSPFPCFVLCLASNKILE